MTFKSLKPAELFLTADPGFDGVECFKIIIHQLIFAGVLQVTLKKVKIPHGIGHFNTYYFSKGPNYENYESTNYEKIALTPFQRIQSSIPLPLYTSIIMEACDWDAQYIRKSILLQLLIQKGYLKKTFLNKIDYYPKTELGKQITVEWKKQSSKALSLIQTNTVNSFWKAVEIVEQHLPIVPKIPFREIEKNRLQIFEKMLTTLKAYEANSNGLEQDIQIVKYLFPTIGNPDFTFNLFVQNFDAQLTGGFENEE